MQVELVLVLFIILIFFLFAKSERLILSNEQSNLSARLCLLHLKGWFIYFK